MTKEDETQTAPPLTQPTAPPGREPPPRPAEDSSAADPPVPAGGDNPQSIDALKRLSELYPKEVGKILDGNDADKWSSQIFSNMNTKMDHHGWACIADVAEFVGRWKPGNNTGQQTKSGKQEQLIAIVRADLVFDRLREFCTAAQALLGPHCFVRDDAKPLSQSDCETVFRLVGSSHDAIENAQTDWVEYVVEFSKQGEPDEDAEPSATGQPADDSKHTDVRMPWHHGCKATMSDFASGSQWSSLDLARDRS